MLRIEDLDSALADLDLEVATPAPRTRIVRIPAEPRGPLALTLVAGERTVALQAFLIRRPDRSAEEIHRHLLHSHWGSAPWRFALDELGDIYVLASLDQADLDTSALDGVLGVLSVLVSQVYDGLLRTGFDLT